jgi:hypothetical protein
VSYEDFVDEFGQDLAALGNRPNMPNTGSLAQWIQILQNLGAIGSKVLNSMSVASTLTAIKG